MRSSTIIGLVVGGAVAAAGGVAYAATRKEDPTKNPFFLYPLQAGEDLSTLAKRFFGDAAKWKVLQAGLEKPETDPKAVPVGAVIKVPCKWHVVRPGDNLSDIAKALLGDPKRYGRILAANSEVKPDKLEVGRALAVPFIEEAQSKTPPLQKVVEAIQAERLPVDIGLNYLGVV